MSLQNTKIICTIGPASDDEAMLCEMIRAGMDVARLNFSHGSPEEHEKTFRRVRSASEKVGKPIAILQDLPGPKIRIGVFKNEPVRLVEGQQFILDCSSEPGDETRVGVSHPEILRQLTDGAIVTLADGEIRLEVQKAEGNRAVCNVAAGGELRSSRGLYVPGQRMSFGALTEKDRHDLEWGARMGVDWVALSFVRDAQDAYDAREILASFGAEIPLVAKIERPEPLETIDETVAAFDAVMVARGDLGLQTPMEEVPFAQKRIIHAARDAGIPSIAATQMLESMIERPLPTRAEITDVANAVLDGADALMLSGETAVGVHPVRVIRVMASIARYAEQQKQYFSYRERPHSQHPSQAIAAGACRIAAETKVRAILCCTETGFTARAVAAYRPGCPIIAATPMETTLRRLALCWGVVPLPIPYTTDTESMLRNARQAAIEKDLIRTGDTIVITAGLSPHKPGGTNIIKVEEIK